MKTQSYIPHTFHERIGNLNGNALHIYGANDDVGVLQPLAIRKPKIQRTK